MRIDRLLANMGVGSRKEVRHLLRNGAVRVNDEIVRRPNVHVDEKNDVITYLGERIVYRPFIYLMMNKAPGVLSATEDMREQTVIDFLSAEHRHFTPFPVGRLDKDTEGLLLISNDGKFAHNLLSPKKDVPKTYYAHIDGIVTEEDLAAFSKGVLLDDGYETKPGHLTILSAGPVSKIELTITEGKYHQVKRMFQAVGKKVVYLKRIKMGPLSLDETIPLGGYRELTQEEMEKIKVFQQDE